MINKHLTYCVAKEQQQPGIHVQYVTRCGRLFENTHVCVGLVINLFPSYMYVASYWTARWCGAPKYFYDFFRGYFNSKQNHNYYFLDFPIKSLLQMFILKYTNKSIIKSGKRTSFHVPGKFSFLTSFAFAKSLDVR